MTHHAISRLPAIVIGGPPHAGKSVLANSLKKSLRAAEVPFHHFSATPDGEGDWFQESSPATGQILRQKKAFTERFVAQLCRDIDQRPLPFLMDVGGKPKDWQEQIFDHCTHAILLVKDEASAEVWQAMMKRWNVVIIAVIYSQPEGTSILEADTPIIRGTITDLNRHTIVSGPVFEALLNRLRALFAYDYDDLFQRHQQDAPTDLVADLRTIYRQLYPSRKDYQWLSSDIPAVLDYLPADTSVAVYGPAPVWLYTAIARLVVPQSFYQFDARLGWVTPVELVAAPATDSVFQTEAISTNDIVCIKIRSLTNYLAHQSYMVDLPVVSTDQGVIFSCQLPMWLQTSLALFYQSVAWIAFLEPRWEDQAVVIATTERITFSLGQVIAVPPAGMALFRNAVDK